MKKLSLLMIGTCFIASASFAEIESVAVLGSPSSQISSNYTKQAYQLGQQLAQKKKELVYGGNGIGLGGAVFNGAFNQKGTITGISTADLFKEQCPKTHECQKADVIIADNIYERNKLIFESADAFVFMPGGFETLNEFAVINMLGQVEENQMKPIVFFNVNHFWDKLRDQLFEMRKQETVSKDVFDSIIFVDKLKDVLPSLDKAQQSIEKKEKQQSKKKLKSES